MSMCPEITRVSCCTTLDIDFFLLLPAFCYTQHLTLFLPSPSCVVFFLPSPHHSCFFSQLDQGVLKETPTGGEKRRWRSPMTEELRVVSNEWSSHIYVRSQVERLTSYFFFSAHIRFRLSFIPLYFNGLLFSWPIVVLVETVFVSSWPW